MKQESLARKLQLLRAERGLTLVQASALTGVTRGTLSELENGKRVAYMPTLSKIAEGYGVDVRELLLEDPVGAPKVSASPSERESDSSAGPAKLLEDPRVLDWLEGQKAELLLMSDEEFVAHIADIDTLEDLEDLAQELSAEETKVLEALGASEVWKKLFPTRVSDFQAEKERLHEAMRPAREAFKLKAEIRHEYSRRELALSNYSQHLYATGVTEDFLIHPWLAATMTSSERRRLEKARQRALEALREELVGVGA